MSVIDEVVAANQTYARSFNLGHLPMPPARKLAVVACMDARLTIEPMLGLKTGEAHIIRNAGGLITEDALRSLVISHHLLGTREVLIINHTDCGMLTFRDEDLRERLRKETGAAPETPRRFYAFSDIEENVRRQIQAAREHSWIPAGITIRGFVYELRTGWVNGKLVGALRLYSIRCQKQPGILIAASLWSTIRTETSTSITNT